MRLVSMCTAFLSVIFMNSTTMLSQITGGGTANYLSKFTGPTAIGNSILYELSGKIGIGITIPVAPLHVVGSANQGVRISGGASARMTLVSSDNSTNLWNLDNSGGSLRIFRENYSSTGSGTNGAVRMTILDNGNVGIGTTANPSQKLDVNGNILAQGGSMYVGVANTGLRAILQTSGRDLAFDLSGQGGTKTPLYLSYYGNVLINKTSQVNLAYKLDVAGGIRADSIVVNTTGADFVFDENYKLPDLAELEQYVVKEKHLPDVPSADEMQKEGMSVGSMQTKLLKKVEELTLYVIEQNKRIEKLEKENSALKRK